MLSFAALDEEQIFLKGIDLPVKGIGSYKKQCFERFFYTFSNASSKEVKLSMNGKKSEQKTMVSSL